jgi:hypothetical protein
MAGNAAPGYFGAQVRDFPEAPGPVRGPVPADVTVFALLMAWRVNRRGLLVDPGRQRGVISYVKMCVLSELSELSRGVTP